MTQKNFPDSRMSQGIAHNTKDRVIKPYQRKVIAMATKIKNKLVLESSNYEMFRHDNSNRVADIGKNKPLKDSMEKYGWLDAYPAFVVPDGDKFVIKDGQHRIDAAQSLGIPVKYMVSANGGIDISEINNAQRKWSIADYVNCFISKGKKHYVRLMEFHKESGLGIGLSATLLGYNRSPDKSRAHIKDGTFKIDDESHAIAVLSVVQAIKNMNADWAFKHSLVMAISLILRHTQASKELLCKKIRSNPGLLKNMPTWSEFVVMLHNVYNHNTKVSDRVDITFKVQQGVMASRPSQSK